MRNALVDEYPNESYPEIILVERKVYCEDEGQFQIQAEEFSHSVRKLRRTMKAEKIEGEY